MRGALEGPRDTPDRVTESEVVARRRSITYMRYRIVVWELLDCVICNVSEYGPRGPAERTHNYTYTIPYEELKVNDLQHVLEALYVHVSEVTP